MGKEREMEHKVFPAFAIKVDADQGIVEAVVSTMGVLDYGDDIIENGAFVQTITQRGRKIRVLDAHNSWKLGDVIGMPLEMREIGRDELPAAVLEKFPEATGGLLTKTQYLMDTPEGAGAFARIKAGAVDEYSIGYQVITAEYRKVKRPDGTEVNARVLKEIKLWEYSPVVWGMNPATATVGAKAGRHDEKEMTAQGAIMRMGDYLQGRMRYTLDSCANEWLIYGRISAEDHAQISAAMEAGVKAFVAALPEALALTQINSPRASYYYDNLPVEGEAKALSTEDKAGRVLSDRNARLIGSAYIALGDVMKSAGLIEAEADDEADAESEKSAAPPTKEKSSESPTQAGPDAQDATTPPTDEMRKRLLLEIEGELDDISILEAQ